MQEEEARSLVTSVRRCSHGQTVKEYRTRVYKGKKGVRWRVIHEREKREEIASTAGEVCHSTVHHTDLRGPDWSARGECGIVWGSGDALWGFASPSKASPLFPETEEGGRKAQNE